jgi:hypothetical protein
MRQGEHFAECGEIAAGSQVEILEKQIGLTAGHAM